MTIAYRDHIANTIEIRLEEAAIPYVRSELNADGPIVFRIRDRDGRGAATVTVTP